MESVIAFFGSHVQGDEGEAIESGGYETATAPTTQRKAAKANRRKLLHCT